MSLYKKHDHILKREIAHLKESIAILKEETEKDKLFILSLNKVKKEKRLTLKELYLRYEIY